MSEYPTIGARIKRASDYFHHKEGVILTTFNLSAAFLEEQALPLVMGVEATSTAARRAELHQELGVTPCTVFYDPHVAPKISGRYRYVARPVPLRNRFFHPKLVVIAGRSEDGNPWVYLAVSSANLSLSGWGRNAESFGETWIYTKVQRSWKALDDLLDWIQSHSPLGEETSDSDALMRVRAVLARMPTNKRYKRVDAPWTGTTSGQLYSSVVNTEGLPSFLQMGRTRRPSVLYAYSPYWADIAAQVAAFNARNTFLIPGLRLDGELGMSQEQTQGLKPNVEIHHNTDETGERFWHMKAYWILHGDKAYAAVGSCNFTQAGLSGVTGNVEAMLVFETESDWLPNSEPTAIPDLPETIVDDGPEAPPVAIVVAFDWRTKTWRWWLDAGPRQHDFQLHLPKRAAISIDPGTTEIIGTPPPRGSNFRITYQDRSGEQREWQGQVVELNLDYSSRVYGQPLTASEILDSWRGRTLSSGAVDETEKGESEEGIDDIEHPVPAAFDAVNLYDLFRSMRALHTKLGGLGEHPEIQRALLVGRSDSLMALAHLANQEGEATVVRYLVLREICGVISEWADLLEAELVHSTQEMADQARTRTMEQLLLEVDEDRAKANAMLDWFEKRLSGDLS